MPVNRNDLIWKATVKAYPAISDLQAISGFVRVKDVSLNVGAGNFNQDIYTVPAGQIFVQQLLYVYCAQADPTFVQFMLRSGIIDYNYYWAPYGGGLERHFYTNEIMYDEGEIVRVFWMACLATTDVYAYLFGYLIDKY